MNTNRQCEVSTPDGSTCPNKATWILRDVLGQPSVCDGCYQVFKVLKPSFITNAEAITHGH